MGDLSDWSPESNGAVINDTSSAVVLSALSAPFNPTATIDSGKWEIVEHATQEIIAHVQPTFVSEKRRMEVINYVQCLIRDTLGCEVFPFGSVPLKTYLPDGDIDLTAFGGLNVEDALASDVRTVLEGEEQNAAAKFVVKDVQLICAEVKLVKCLVQNIVVDISFNQIGGLCTLCFLEQVDILIGKNNLFKRSIILIKAWCYYESRILGAHHGLISTYALETLVLYIFHLFHSSLNGPLAVLYKFLDYFSKFDWDHYCISLKGPIHVSSLPELVAEVPKNGGGDLLLSDEFLRDSMGMFAVPSRVSETISRTFPQKHLNIVDPLKENNNLGRSVSKGNFFRIKSAISFGARRLKDILSGPEESLADEIRKYFPNTMDRHGKNLRPDVQDHVPLYDYNGFGWASPPSLQLETYQQDMRYSGLESIHSRPMFGYLEESFCNGVNNVQVLSQETAKESERGSMNVENDTNRIESGFRLSGDAKDLASYNIQDLNISNDMSDLSRDIEEKKSSPGGKVYHAPHLYCSPPYLGNGEVGKENQEKNGPDDNKKSSRVDETSVSGNGDDGSVAEFYPSYQRRVIVGSPENIDFLPNLGGEYGSHLNSLRYGRWWYEYVLSVPPTLMPPTMISRFQGKETWETMQWFARPSQDFSSHNGNGHEESAFYSPVSQSMIPIAAFGREDKPKTRGTGTYIPNTNHYRDRPSTPRGRYHTQVRSPRINGHHTVISTDINLVESNSHELSLAQYPALQGGGKPRSPDLLQQSDSPRRNMYPNSNGSISVETYIVNPLSNAALNIVNPLSNATPIESNGQPPMHEHSFVPTPKASLPVPQLQRQKSVLGVYQEKAVEQPQQLKLKDQTEFPPLSL